MSARASPTITFFGLLSLCVPYVCMHFAHDGSCPCMHEDICIYIHSIMMGTHVGHACIICMYACALHACVDVMQCMYVCMTMAGHPPMRAHVCMVVTQWFTHVCLSQRSHCVKVFFFTVSIYIRYTVSIYTVYIYGIPYNLRTKQTYVVIEFYVSLFSMYVRCTLYCQNIHSIYYREKKMK